MIVNKCRSLQESMMEYVVFNFEEAFNNKDRLKSRTKLLPPHLFEKILCKGKELRWVFDFEHLEELLGYRNVLCWKNVNVNSLTLSGKALNIMNCMQFPLKTLSIDLCNISKKNMKSLCRMGSTIENLDLSYDFRSTLEFLNAPFPKLKKLYLNGRGDTDEINLDFRRFAETLEELQIENEDLDESSIISLASLTQLKVLSLLRAKHICDNNFFIGALSSMTKLRTLDLRDSISIGNEFRLKLLTVISKLAHLENIDISCNEDLGKEWILQVMKCKKWKRFGMYFNREFMRDYSHYNDFKPWAEEIFGMYEETWLPTCEKYINDSDRVLDISDFIFESLPRVTADQIPKIENMLLTAFEFDMSEDATESIIIYLDTGRCTQDFVSYYDTKYRRKEMTQKAHECMVMRIIENVHVSSTMLNIIDKELNKGLSVKLLRGLLIFSFVDYQYEQEDIPSKDACAKAIKRNCVQDDVLVIMKRLLVKINSEALNA